MRVTGIVAEYNPFHNGHLYHLELGRTLTDADYTVAIMSGNFVQRGEPALVDKWLRAKMALEQGVDLVLELPVGYALAPAEDFAYGAIATLDACGVVTDLVFGSECGDLSSLQVTAQRALNENEQERATIRRYLDEGLSHPQARAMAYGDDAGPLASPNDILGVEYLKALTRLKSSIRPHTILRTKGYHDPALHGAIASATAIRRGIDTGDDAWRAAMPKAAAARIASAWQRGDSPMRTQVLSTLALGALRRCSPEELSKIGEVTEGLENRIARSAAQADTLAEFYALCKTRRYPLSRLRRIAMKAMLGIHGVSHLTPPAYIRVLGLRTDAAPLLKRLQENARLPIITQPGRQLGTLPYPAQVRLRQDFRASDLYALGLTSLPKRKGGRDYTQPLVILK